MLIIKYNQTHTHIQKHNTYSSLFKALSCSVMCCAVLCWWFGFFGHMLNGGPIRICIYSFVFGFGNNMWHALKNKQNLIPNYFCVFASFFFSLLLLLFLKDQSRHLQILNTQSRTVKPYRTPSTLVDFRFISFACALRCINKKDQKLRTGANAAQFLFRLFFLFFWGHYSEKKKKNKNNSNNKKIK